MATLAQERILKTRQLVLDYLASNAISDKLNRTVNDLCRSRPRDPWLFLADALSDHQKEAPLIDRLVARNGVTNDGDLSLQLNIYGRVSQNRAPKHLSSETLLSKPKHLSSFAALTSNDEKDNINKSDSNGKNNENSESNNNSNNSNGETSLISEVQSLITQFISPNLRYFKMNEQIKIDSELKKLYFEKLETIETIEVKFDLLLSMSILSAITASKSLKKPFYQYLYNLYIVNSSKLNDLNLQSAGSSSGGGSISRDNSSQNANDSKTSDALDNTSLHLPNFMCILTQSDNLPSIGVMVADTVEPNQRISMVKQLTRTMEESIDIGQKKGKGDNSNKGTKALRDDNTGALILNQFKKFDELFKFIKDCIAKCNFEDSDNLFTFSIICDNKNAFRKYDSDTNKYTIFGEKKPMENSDLVSYFAKIVSDHKEIGYLEDVMDASDTDGYTLLCSELNDKVTIVGNELYGGTLEKIETGLQQKWTQSVLIPIYRLFTVSNMFQITKHIENSYNLSQTLMLDDTFDNNASQPYFIDLAVACRCGLIRLPLPIVAHGGRKYNRWLFLNDELKASNDVLQDSVQETKPTNSVLPPTEEEPEALP